MYLYSKTGIHLRRVRGGRQVIAAAAVLVHVLRPGRASRQDNKGRHRGHCVHHIRVHWQVGGGAPLRQQDNQRAPHRQSRGQIEIAAGGARSGGSRIQQQPRQQTEEVAYGSGGHVETPGRRRSGIRRSVGANDIRRQPPPASLSTTQTD